MTERLNCTNPECSYTILPTTAEKTGGFCMPCVQRKAREEHEEFVRKNRRDVNLFEGLEDPVEILKIMHRPKEHDPLIRYIPHPDKMEDIYARLDQEQISSMARHAVAKLGAGESNQAEEIAGCLTAFTNGERSLLLDGFILFGQLSPGFMFVRGTPCMRDRIIDLLNAVRVSPNNALAALAWIGDSKVVELFGQWKRIPPPWCESLYISPERYAESAGWELSPELSRRDLYSQTCYPLKPEAGEGSGDEVMLQSVRDDKCPWCSGPLRNALVINRIPELAPLFATTGGAIEFIDCGSCSGFAGAIYGELDANGARWSSHNVRPKYLPEERGDWENMPNEKLALGSIPRSPWHAASWYLPTTFSQLGGHPTWIQDANYPPCPQCGRLMRFVGQVSHEDLHEHGEGIDYAFLCVGCGITATTYQCS